MGHVWVRIAAIVALMLAPPPESEAARLPADTLDARARRVLDRLEPAVQFTNREPPPLSLEARMAHYRVPAVVVAVIDEGEIAWTAAMGTKRAGRARPVTTESLFHVKSVSKPVVAMATLELVERGELELDEPIHAYLESYRVPDNEHTRATPPTVRHVLSHAAGFTRGGVDSYRPDEPLPTLLESVTGAPPSDAEPVDVTFEPGTSARYSGGGYGVLQQLLVDVTGEPFPELVDRLVFTPLDMRHSAYFDGPVPDVVLPFVALGHDSEGETLPGGYEILPIQAAGGLWSTARDLARFVLEVQRAWDGRGEVLDRETAREMASAQAASWGLGVEVGRHDDTPFIRHGGSGDGFRSVVFGYLGTGRGAAVVANGDGAGELRDEILRAVAREYDWPGFRDVTRYELARVAIDRLRDLVATYVWESGLESAVELREGTLWTRFHTGAWQRLHPLSDERFVTSSDETYAFEDPDAEGRPQTLRYVDESGAYRAHRAP